LLLTGRKEGTFEEGKANHLELRSFMFSLATIKMYHLILFWEEFCNCDCTYIRISLDMFKGKSAILFFIISNFFTKWRRTAHASNSELLGSKIFLVSFILYREFIFIPEMETHPRLST
jgi:hypothetical protein